MYKPTILLKVEVFNLVKLRYFTRLFKVYYLDFNQFTTVIFYSQDISRWLLMSVQTIIFSLKNETETADLMNDRDIYIYIIRVAY